MIISYLIALTAGILFGFALQKGGLTRYRNITGVFRFTNLTVIKFMLTAMLTASLGIYILRESGLVQFPNIPATYIVGNLLGGLVFGVGMALTGFCPGTIAAGAGEGKLDYLIPGMLGLLSGSVLFGLTYEKFFPQIARLANYGNITLPDILGINPILLVIFLIACVLVLFYHLERGLKRRDKLEDEEIQA